MDLEGQQTTHIWFNLAKCSRHGHNVIGHQATIVTPGQRTGNITMCVQCMLA